MRVLIIKTDNELVKATDISDIPVAGDYLVIRDDSGEPEAYKVVCRAFGNVTDVPRECVRLFVDEVTLDFCGKRKEIEEMERKYLAHDV